MKNTYQIVTGATNVKESAIVPVSLVGATLANGMKIIETTLRGSQSSGMICSKEELGIDEKTDGIWILPNDTPIGIDFIDYAKLKDTLLDINILPNRGDCQSIYGLAREISTLLNTSLKEPTIKVTEISPPPDLTIKLEAKKQCPMYTGRIIKGCSKKESPLWLQRRLDISGIQPLSLIVDITNYVLLELGQPLHAFDLNQINNQTIIVRTAQPNEKLQTLNNEEHQLQNHTLLIADPKKNLALAGIMGGKNSEIHEKTTDILIESAYFEPTLIRKDQSRYNCRSESAIRFEKGVDWQAIITASNRATSLIQTLASPKETYPLVVEQDKTQSLFKPLTIPFNHTIINKFLGTNWSETSMIKLVTNQGFKIKNETEKKTTPSESKVTHKTITVPSWRQHDIKTISGLAEEIARIKGYHTIEETLPTKHIPIDKPTRLEKQITQCETTLIQSGYHQVNTFPMISEKEYKTYQLNHLDDLKLQNPLTPELSVMRPSLLPSLLKILTYNHHRQQNNIKLFEIGKTFHITSSKTIKEEHHAVALISGSIMDHCYKQSNKQATCLTLPYLKSVMQNILSSCSIKHHQEKYHQEKYHQEKHVEEKHVEEKKQHHEPPSSPAYLHPQKSLLYTVEIGKNRQEIGQIGFLHPLLSKTINSDIEIGYIMLNLTQLSTISVPTITYQPIPRFPSIRRDIAFLAPTSLTFREIEEILLKFKPKLVTSIFLFDEFTSNKLGENKKSLAFGVIYQNTDKTLSDNEVNKSHDKFCKFLTKKLPVTIR